MPVLCPACIPSCTRDLHHYRLLQPFLPLTLGAGGAWLWGPMGAAGWDPASCCTSCAAVSWGRGLAGDCERFGGSCGTRRP